MNLGYAVKKYSADMIFKDSVFGVEVTNTEVMQTPITLLGKWRRKSHDFGGKLLMLILDGF